MDVEELIDEYGTLARLLGEAAESGDDTGSLETQVDDAKAALLAAFRELEGRAVQDRRPATGRPR